MSETRRVRRSEGYGVCDAADREKGICPSVKFATKVFIPKRTKMGENAIAAKAWQERLSGKRQKQSNRDLTKSIINMYCQTH